MIICPFHWLTGLSCPFCGGQRMIVEMLHGRVAEAFWLNPGLAIGVPLVGAWWLWKGEISSRAAFVILLLAIAWGILRNLMSI